VQSPPLLEDSEPKNIRLVIVSDGTDKLLTLIKEIIKLPKKMFAVINEMIVLDDGGGYIH
jgi:hypothetical protein